MKRFYALDVFRGSTVALMILVNNPGSWSYIYPPLKHANWHGCTPTDLVFPFFLFAVGNALAFVMPRMEQTGNFWQKVPKRALLIFLIGLTLNWFPFVKWEQGELVAKPWESVRILGVLQRIALAYFFASIIIYFAGAKRSFQWGMLILLAYWGICYAWGAEGDPYSLKGYFGTAVDQLILGEKHMYHGEGVAFDPEGLTSTLPAIVQVIFGYLVGNLIIKKGSTPEMLSKLMVYGALAVFAGFCWDLFFPINKKIWTSSYVLYTTGLASLVLGVMIYAIEFRQFKGAWTNFFNVFGKNPLFIFVLSGVWVKLYALARIPDGMKEDGTPSFVNAYGWIYKHIFQQLLGNYPGSLAFALFHVAIFWGIGKLLDMRKIYIRV